MLKNHRDVWLLALFLLASTPSRADAPEDIWRARCKTCHGDDGRGRTKVGLREHAPDFTTAKWQTQHPDDAIRNTIRNGSPQNKVMKSYKDRLGADEIDALVRYLRAFKKA